MDAGFFVGGSVSVPLHCSTELQGRNGKWDSASDQSLGTPDDLRKVNPNASFPPTTSRQQQESPQLGSFD